MDLDALAAARDEQPCIALAVLFGSHARGRARSDSDVDVAVRLDEPDAHNAVARRLERAMGQSVDLVPLDQAPPLLRLEIARGTLLVERERGAWPAFKAKAMIDWWDWAPTARRQWRTYIERNRQKVANGQR